MELGIKDVWPEKKAELLQWLRYNIGIGLLPVWLSWILLPLVGIYNFHKPFIDGTFLAFVVTLSGTSMGLFMEETRMELREVQRSIYFSLFLIIIIGTGALVMAIVAASNVQLVINPYLLAWFSTVGLAFAIYVNLKLAAARLTLADKDFMDGLAKRKKAELDAAAINLAQKAKGAHAIDGLKL